MTTPAVTLPPTRRERRSIEAFEAAVKTKGENQALLSNLVRINREREKA